MLANIFYSTFIIFSFITSIILLITLIFDSRNNSSVLIKQVLYTEADSIENVSFVEENLANRTLDGNFHSCFIFPFKRHINNDALFKKEMAALKASYATGMKNKSQEVKDLTLLHILSKFNDLSRHLKIKTVIIDPFILYCMISVSFKKILSRRAFKLDASKMDQYAITLGILQKYVRKIEMPEALKIMKDNGFEVEFVKRSRLRWMNSTHDAFTTHSFLKYNHWTFHLVVFHQRNNYFWHSSLLHQPLRLIPQKKNLYFADSDAAFDNFTTTSLELKFQKLKNLYIPSRPAEFLFQIDTSKFLECNITIVEAFDKIQSAGIPKNHSRFSVLEFNEILVNALQELKYQFDPLFLRFWIWSGTMLGWYRQCNVIPYTGDVDFAAWSYEVDSLEVLEKIFQENNLLKIRQRMGLVDQGLEFNLNCRGLRVDIFFLQTESNGTWYAGHRPSKGYYFKYHHPNFSLCSAELLENKVLVPCETESVIATEYGSEWILPVTSWNYESSIKNRGPNIYWNSSMLEKVYINY